MSRDILIKKYIMEMKIYARLISKSISLTYSMSYRPCSAQPCTNISGEEEIVNQYATSKGTKPIYKAVFFITLSVGERKSCFYLLLSLNNHITEIMRLYHLL